MQSAVCPGFGAYCQAPTCLLVRQMRNMHARGFTTPANGKRWASTSGMPPDSLGAGSTLQANTASSPPVRCGGLTEFVIVPVSLLLQALARP
jgi:hypothetical protein